MFHLSFLFILFHLDTISCDDLHNQTALDRDALLSFKRSVPHDALKGWNSTSPHCTWFGVTCDRAQTQVQALNLSGLGLSGTIPPRLSNLTSLQELDLRDNSLYGSIPPELARVSSLRILLLGNNKLNGTLPVSISNCYNLERIGLERNGFSGNIPYELGRLTRLKVLDVSVNSLTGIIPPTFGNLSSLTALMLARNKLSGKIPDELGSLENLNTLQLSENQFTGEIPLSLSNISSLVYLSLTKNNLTGSLPSYFGRSLPKLTSIFLAHNMLGGPLPSSLFKNASQLKFVDLSSNDFQGPLPLFREMSSLVNLHLGVNHLTSTTELNGFVFDSLKNCTQLEILFLNANRLAGDLPRSVANLSSSLREFCIDDNFLTGTIPQGLGNYQNLTALSMDKNMFNGSIPNSLGRLRKLQKLALQENMLSGEIPDMFGDLTELFELTMGANNFSGRVPPSLAKSEALRILGLAWNNLNGSIPKEIFGLSNLNSFRLARNKLTGSLPDEVGNLKQLQFLNVEDNQLSGNIPITIGGCESLGVLNMARNRINGSIPGSVGDLKALESLDLSSNSLSGPIPQNLGNLTTLKYLNLSFNHLEGQVPSHGVFLNLTADSLEKNGKLCAMGIETSRRLGIASCSTRKRSSTSLLIKILVPVLVLVFILLISVLLCLALYAKKRRNKVVRKGQANLSSPTYNVRWPKIPYSEIRAATNGFDSDRLIGKGAFGSVYRATFPEGTNIGGQSTLAVKVIDLGQSKASKSFDAECEALRNVRHRNLVTVLTSCSSTDHNGGEFKALVMEFMSNGNLDRWLYPQCDVSESCFNFSFSQRLDVAIDVASAIDYLHHDCDPPVVHCDLKPANVLLDDEMVAHVGDFGLAKFLSENALQNGSSTTGLRGSIGYIPPEYGLSSQVSTSGDVYSFGIMLLEMFIAKKPTDENFKDGLSLNKFATAVHGNKVTEIADWRLFHGDEGATSDSINSSSCASSSGNTISSTSTNDAKGNWATTTEENVVAVIKVGLSCVAHNPKDRLSMREILKELLELKKRL